MKAGWHIYRRAWCPNWKFRQPITFIIQEKRRLLHPGHVKNFAHICREPSAKRKSPDDISRFPEPKHHAGRQVATAACGGLTLRGAVRGATLQRRRDEPTSDDIPEFPSPPTAQRPEPALSRLAVNEGVSWRVPFQARRGVACSGMPSRPTRRMKRA